MIEMMWASGILLTLLAAASAAQAPGVAVGARIPVFEAVDQNGRAQTFETIRGPKGALLVFYRSADW